MPDNLSEVLTRIVERELPEDKKALEIAKASHITLFFKWILPAAKK